MNLAATDPMSKGVKSGQCRLWAFHVPPYRYKGLLSTLARHPEQISTHAFGTSCTTRYSVVLFT